MTEFETFWSAYPRRIAKGAARQAFARAIRKTTLETLLKALETYIRHKPDTIDYCHASTWLNQERWEDEWEGAAKASAPALLRPAKTVDEVLAFYKSAGKPISPEIAKAKTVDDLPVFARMIPNNVTPLRRVG